MSRGGSTMITLFAGTVNLSEWSQILTDYGLSNNKIRGGKAAPKYKSLVRDTDHTSANRPWLPIRYNDSRLSGGANNGNFIAALRTHGSRPSSSVRQSKR